MRDDLHHTLALTDPWRTVLRLAGQSAPRETVADAMVYAVNRELKTSLDARWHADFEATLRDSASDLFGDAASGARLAELERRATTCAERLAVETAQGLLAAFGHIALHAQTHSAIAKHFLEAGIEHVAAKVATDRGPSHGISVRLNLSARITECDFNKEPSKAEPKKARAAKLLDMPLALVLD